MSAAEAVRLLTRSAGGAAKARVELARQLWAGTLIATAGRIIDKTMVSDRHRGAWLNLLHQHHSRDQLGPLIAPRTQEHHTPGPGGPQVRAIVPADFWRCIFHDDGQPCGSAPPIECTADWSRGDFQRRECLRFPVEGWADDPGDWREVAAIDVRFPAWRLVEPDSDRFEPAAKPGRPKGAGGWAAADAALVARMHEIMAGDPGMTVHRAAGLIAEQAKGSAALETRQRRLARRYRQTYGGK